MKKLVTETHTLTQRSSCQHGRINRHNFKKFNETIAKCNIYGKVLVTEGLTTVPCLNIYLPCNIYYVKEGTYGIFNNLRRLSGAPPLVLHCILQPVSLQQWFTFR